MQFVVASAECLPLDTIRARSNIPSASAFFSSIFLGDFACIPTWTTMCELQCELQCDL